MVSKVAFFYIVRVLGSRGSCGSLRPGLTGFGFGSSLLGFCDGFFLSGLG